MEICTTMVVTENGVRLFWFAIGGEIGYHDLAGIFRGVVHDFKDFKIEMAEMIELIE